MREAAPGRHIFGKIRYLRRPGRVQESQYMGRTPRLRRAACAVAVFVVVAVWFSSAVPVANGSANGTDRYAHTRGYVLDHVTTRDKVFFITVDDGSHLSRKTTQYIRNLHIPITTFALPEPLNHHRRRFINLLRQTGMTFENHSQTHHIVSTMSYARQRSEICAGNREVNRVIRRKPVFFRPPGGGWDDDTVKAAKKCGIKRIVMWNVVADEGHIVRAGTGTDIQRGDIVLLHYLDSLPDSLAIVLRAAKKAGLRPALLRDYLLPPAPPST